MVLRFLGLLEGVELRTFDLMLRSRLPEPPDPRITILTLDESDFENQDPTKLSPSTLKRLLESLNPLQPNVIGLDVNRSYIRTENQGLSRTLSSTPNLISICKHPTVKDGIAKTDGTKPYPVTEIASERIGFSNSANDGNSPEDKAIVRRQKLVSNPESVSPIPDCTAKNAFSLLIAQYFLAKQQIFYTPPQGLNGVLKLGTVSFPRIYDYTGGYVRRAIDDYQILLNYRSGRPAQEVSLKSFLENPNSYKNAIQNKVVLIGVTATTEDWGDISPTPYGDLPGVVIHAHMTSQLLSAVLDRDRPLLWSFPEGVECLWILVWTLAGARIGYLIDNQKKLLKVALVVLMGHGLFCWIALVSPWGAWIPLIPSSLGFLSASSILSRRRSQSQTSLP